MYLADFLGVWAFLAFGYWFTYQYLNPDVTRNELIGIAVIGLLGAVIVTAVALGTWCYE